MLLEAISLPSAYRGGRREDVSPKTDAVIEPDASRRRAIDRDGGTVIPKMFLHNRSESG
jgi:hypothetical protein